MAKAKVSRGVLHAQMEQAHKELRGLEERKVSLAQAAKKSAPVLRIGDKEIEVSKERAASVMKDIFAELDSSIDAAKKELKTTAEALTR